MATLIQLRRGTDAEWTSANPTLAAGEVGISTDINKFKIGDGTTAWTSLSYASLTPTEIQTAIDSAVSGLVDSAPGVLDTLNEIAAAINDDPNFFTTVATNLSNHEADTTNIHGIADTSLLATTSYVDTAESDAVSTANAYADSLASNYDAAGSASAVASDLSDHELATTSVHGIADTSALETQTGAQSKADTAESNAVSTANAYSDSLASNYDSAGSASAVASDLTDHENSSTNVHGIVDTSALATKTYADNAASTAAANLVDSAPTTLDTLNELAAALGDDPNFATTVTNSLAGKQPLDADLTAIAALTGTSGFLKKTAADTWSLDTNTYLTGNETITLTGDVSGSGTTSISVTVADDSHNHIISNVDGLQDALNEKLDSTSYTASDVLTKIKTVDGSTSGLDADLLDGQHGSYFLDWTNTTNKPDPTITLGGDASGSVTLTNLGNGTLTVTVADNSHNHVISNVDGLQTALNGKANLSGASFSGNVTVLSEDTAGTAGVRNVYHSTSAPSGGNNGDIWLVYL